MFVRLRWFILGFATAAVAGFFVVKRARAMRQRLDAEGLARIVASYVADAVEAVGIALQRSGAEPSVTSTEETEHS